MRQYSREELGLLILGLKTICVVGQEPVRQRLLEQLERELSVRYGVRIGEPLP